MKQENESYQKIANVLTYLENNVQESGKKSHINGMLLNHNDLTYNKDYQWYVGGSITFYENVLKNIPFEEMKPFLIESGYLKQP